MAPMLLWCRSTPRLVHRTVWPTFRIAKPADWALRRSQHGNFYGCRQKIRPSQQYLAKSLNVPAPVDPLLLLTVDLPMVLWPVVQHLAPDPWLELLDHGHPLKQNSCHYNIAYNSVIETPLLTAVFVKAKTTKNCGLIFHKCQPEQNGDQIKKKVRSNSLGDDMSFEKDSCNTCADSSCGTTTLRKHDESFSIQMNTASVGLANLSCAK